MSNTFRNPKARTGQARTRPDLAWRWPLPCLALLGLAVAAATVQAQTATPAQPVADCPAGWVPAPPGTRGAGRCVPGTVAAPTRPQQGGPGHGDPGQPRDDAPAQATEGCPTGWVPAATGGAGRCVPGTVAAPTRPQQGGPGHGDPGQPREAAAMQKALPDLALAEPFQFADASIAWGNSATVSTDAAAFKQRGRCGFRYAYTTRNQGVVAAGATGNRIRLDAQDGPSLAQDALPALAPDAGHTASGHLLLKPGTWTLYVQADDAQAVAESDEANNLRRVRVTVRGSCE